LVKYPRSEFSRFFRTHVYLRHPAYAEYCLTAIKKAEEFATARNDTQTRDFNGATQ
jgi:hypothetical protein